MRTHDQIHRDTLLRQLDEDLQLLRIQYRYVPVPASRAIDNMAKLCASLVEAVRSLEEKDGR